MNALPLQGDEQDDGVLSSQPSASGKRAPGTEDERAARLAQMMESQLVLGAPEKVGLLTGFK